MLVAESAADYKTWITALTTILGNHHKAQAAASSENTQSEANMTDGGATASVRRLTLATPARAAPVHVASTPMAWHAGSGAGGESSPPAAGAQGVAANAAFVPPPALPQTKVPHFPKPKVGRDKVAPAPFQLPLMIPPKVGPGKPMNMPSFRMARPGDVRSAASDA